MIATTLKWTTVRSFDHVADVGDVAVEFLHIGVDISRSEGVDTAVMRTVRPGSHLAGIAPRVGARPCPGPNTRDYDISGVVYPAEWCDENAKRRTPMCEVTH